ncbi:MAG: CAP domain-containing protein [Spirochaetales bacterium]|nr:CAP domain-containing protein [Spirochaetales bacterium]
MREHYSVPARLITLALLAGVVLGAVYSQSEPASTATAESPAVPLNKGVHDASFATALDLEVVSELNLARTQPEAYIDILMDYKSYIRGAYLEKPGEIRIVLNEGVRAVDEAITFLKKQAPLPPLTLSRGLSLAARDHALDQGKTGQTGHTGSDSSSMGGRIMRYGSWISTAGENIAYGGKSARDFVIQLIVDDGVASRGHRKNIFNPKFLVVGVSCGTHPRYRTVCVQDFAAGYEEK